MITLKPVVINQSNLEHGKTYLCKHRELDFVFIGFWCFSVWTPTDTSGKWKMWSGVIHAGYDLQDLDEIYEVI